MQRGQIHISRWVGVGREWSSFEIPLFVVVFVFMLRSCSNVLLKK